MRIKFLYLKEMYFYIMYSSNICKPSQIIIKKNSNDNKNRISLLFCILSFMKILFNIEFLRPSFCAVASQSLRCKDSSNPIKESSDFDFLLSELPDKFSDVVQKVLDANVYPVTITNDDIRHINEFVFTFYKNCYNKINKDWAKTEKFIQIILENLVDLLDIKKDIKKIVDNNLINHYSIIEMPELSGLCYFIINYDPTNFFLGLCLFEKEDYEKFCAANVQFRRELKKKLEVIGGVLFHGKINDMDPSKKDYIKELRLISRYFLVTFLEIKKLTIINARPKDYLVKSNLETKNYIDELASSSLVYAGLITINRLISSEGYSMPSNSYLSYFFENFNTYLFIFFYNDLFIDNSKLFIEEFYDLNNNNQYIIERFNTQLALCVQKLIVVINACEVYTQINKEESFMMSEICQNLFSQLEQNSQIDTITQIIDRNNHLIYEILTKFHLFLIKKYNEKGKDLILSEIQRHSMLKKAL